ncbi:death domain-associated protein 6 isoform 1-T2 [Pholidichthys leucotaenia]
MAVAPASIADKIIVLDEDEGPQPSSSSSTSSSSERWTKPFTPLRAHQPVPTHIIHSPFATAKKAVTALEAENQKLFAEFVEHCTPLTKDCPEVLNFLQTKYEKASPDFLTSVEFRNTLGRCLTRAQSSHSKTFVYINELCTVLRQHAVRKRQALSKVESGPSISSSNSFQSTSGKSKDKTKGKMDDDDDNEEEEEVNGPVEEEQPSTSGLQDEAETERKAKRASRKQIAYLENLLKAYNEEIHRLQQTELSLDDLEAEDSLYIQEHKLKRKMMKIYEKLCELKNCSMLTGRAIEQKISYKTTRYPEISKRIERFINSPEARSNPPDYQDILEQVLHANKRHNLGLPRKQLNQIAQEAFREVGSRMQERRHLDLVYNFGSHLTDNYKPATDPALLDPTLLRKLRSNREVALSRLDEVITKYAVKQDDTEEQERQKRQQKNKEKGEKEVETKVVNGTAEKEDEEEEEDDCEDDDSSDTDIEKEIQASTQQDGPDDDDYENEEEQVSDGTNREDQNDDQIESISTGEEESVKDEEDQAAGPLSPLSHESKSETSPLNDIPSDRDSPSQSLLMQVSDPVPLPNGNLGRVQEPTDSSSQESGWLVKPSKANRSTTVAANRKPASLFPKVIVNKYSIQTTNGASPPSSPRATRSQKRKLAEMVSQSPQKTKPTVIQDGDMDISLDMGVDCYYSPPPTESTRAESPVMEVVSSSSPPTPPPKKNKVNVATQCDPEEIIVLSDSE